MCFLAFTVCVFDSRRERHWSYGPVNTRRMDPVFVDAEQDPARIKQLFALHNQPIPPHQPGDWVGINLETNKPVVLPNVDAYTQVAPSTPQSLVKEGP